LVEVANLSVDAEPVAGQAVLQSSCIQRVVKLAVVAKKLVEVAEVVVALVAMRSVTPLKTARLLSVVVAARFVSNLVSKSPLNVVVYTPLVTVPALPEMEPVIVAATVKLAKVALVEKRFVLEAVVEKMFVVVAAVVVDLVIESNICAAVKLLAVYVLGIVVEP
jgi:hypothetical protein